MAHDGIGLPREILVRIDFKYHILEFSRQSRGTLMPFETIAQ